MPAVKINITLRADLLERADAYADKNATSRSGLIAMALNEYLDAMEKKPVVADAFSQFGTLMKLAMSGKNDTPEYDAAFKALEAAGETLKK